MWGHKELDMTKRLHFVHVYLEKNCDSNVKVANEKGNQTFKFPSFRHFFQQRMSLQILNISYEMSSGHVRRCLQINEQRVTLLQMFKKKLGIHSEGR